MNAFDVLRERGFVKDCSDERGLRAALERPITVYCGYDPTAPSLHVGHLIPTMALAHLQRLGHRPIALVGGGTALVGDPSGKTAARAVLTPEEIAANIEPIRAQLSRYFDFREGRALLLNNADWLLPLRYIEFLRDIGRHFNVNEMLHAETYRT
ncbi:MAG TPA: tyrosine--tRNA ligase, partial [Bacillota bacterium]